MKKLPLLIIAIALLFASCKEDHILVSMHNSQSKDTTYILSSVPSAQQHNVLVEDFTGVQCPNCPAGHELLVSLDSINSGRILIMGLYVFGFPQANPNAGQRYNGFRSSVATDIGKKIYEGFISEPLIGIDRIQGGDQCTNHTGFGQQGAWSTNIASRLAMPDSLNLSVSSSYDPASSSATIVTKVTYLFTTSQLQNLSIAIVEDSLDDLQEFPSPKNVVMNRFDCVFRGFVTSPIYGDPIFDSIGTKVAGRVCQKVYNYKLDSSLMAKNCRIIAFVHGSGANNGSPIYQAVQTKLIP